MVPDFETAKIELDNIFDLIFSSETTSKLSIFAITLLAITTSKLPNLGDILNMVLGKKPEQPKAKVSPADTTPTPVTTPVPGEMPAGAMSAAQVSSPSSPSMSAPGPVSGGGNTTVIYKKVGGSGGQMQGQPLKSGSATDVPLIASADPSNFYTMYSQLLYNVVG